MSIDSGRGPVFAPATSPVPPLAEFPEELKLVAERKALAGRGTGASPFRMGWIVRPSRLPGGASALPVSSRAWLAERGFVPSGRRWVRWDAALGDDDARSRSG